MCSISLTLTAEGTNNPYIKIALCVTVEVAESFAVFK